VAGGGGSGSLLVVGDSLAVGSAPYLEDALPAWRIQQLARTSKPTSDGVAEITSRGGSLPGVIAVSLGTNDDPSATGTFQSQVNTVIDAAGPSRCVIWANIVRPPYGGVSYAGYNRVLARAATSPNFFVIDWAGMVNANRGLIGGDGVHATPSGYAARGRAIAQAARTCGGGPRGQATPGLPSD
jgi:lysophospholipase L1-like esterase